MCVLFSQGEDSMCQQLIIHRRWVATWCRNWRCLFCWPAFISTFEQSYLSGHCHTEVSLQVWFKWMRGRIRSFSRYVLFCTPIRFTVCNLSVLVDRCLFRHGEWLRYEFCNDALQAAVSSTAGVFFAAVTLILADVRWNQQGNKFAYTGWPNKKKPPQNVQFWWKSFSCLLKFILIRRFILCVLLSTYSARHSLWKCSCAWSAGMNVGCCSKMILVFQKAGNWW